MNLSRTELRTSCISGSLGGPGASSHPQGMVCTFFFETQGILPQEERPLSGECRQYLRVLTTFAPLPTPGGRSSAIQAQEATQLCPPCFPEGEHGGRAAGTGSGASEEWVMSNECVLSNCGQRVKLWQGCQLLIGSTGITGCSTYLFSPRQTRVEGERGENGGWLSVSRSFPLCPWDWVKEAPEREMYWLWIGRKAEAGRCDLGQKPGVSVRKLRCLEPHLS